MAIFDIFKKKQPEKEAKPVKKEIVKEKKTEKVQKTAAPKETVKKEAPKAKSRVSDIAYKILKHPHVTEKATDLAQSNQYTFNVWPESNKIQIKKAIQDLYGVDVVAVRIINIPSKERRVGRITGIKKGYKKAIVRIKEGQKIEVLPR